MKDTIAFYYIWKKHGSCAKTRDDGNLSDDFLPEPEPDVSSETLKLMDRLRSKYLCFALRHMLVLTVAHANTQNDSSTFKITSTLLVQCILLSQPMRPTTRGKRFPNLVYSAFPAFSKASKDYRHCVFHRCWVSKVCCMPVRMLRVLTVFTVRRQTSGLHSKSEYLRSRSNATARISRELPMWYVAK